MKTVTVQNTPCIRQDSESELKKVRMSRNDDIAIFIPRKFLVMNSELHTKGFIGRKLMSRRMINYLSKLINSVLYNAEKQWTKSREGILNFYVTDCIYTLYRVVC